MKRDNFGICLTKAMLFETQSTFTHVRAYEKNRETSPLDLKVLLTFRKCQVEICTSNARFKTTGVACRHPLPKLQ